MILSKLVILSFNILFIAAASLLEHVSYDSNGFSIFQESAETIKIYVSSSGDDTNDGLSESSPVQTIQKGYEILRDGYPDWLLIKRGDVFTTGFNSFRKSGRSSEEPMVIKSYGDTDDRPEIQEGFGGNNIAHVAFLELRFYCPDETDGSGVSLLATLNDILIEDCVFEELTGVAIQDRQFLGSKEFFIRYCIIVGNYPRGTGHCQGMFVYGMEDFLIEGCFFDHNGWKGDGLDGTMFNHNIYFSHAMKNLTIKDTIFSRGASMNIKMRTDEGNDPSVGLQFDNNYFGEGEIGIGIGGNTDEPHRFYEATIENNIFSNTGKLPTPTDRYLGWMLGVSDNVDTSIANNLFIHNELGNRANSYAISFSNTQSKIRVIGNVMAELKGPVLKFSENLDISLYFEVVDNNIQITLNETERQFSRLLVMPQSKPIIFSGNNFWSNNSFEDWFSLPDGTDPDEWMKTTNSKSEKIDFPDPTRNLNTYASSLGLAASAEAFANEFKKQSKFNYLPEYSTKSLNTYVRVGFGMELKTFQRDKWRESTSMIIAIVLIAVAAVMCISMVIGVFVVSVFPMPCLSGTGVEEEYDLGGHKNRSKLQNTSEDTKM